MRNFESPPLPVEARELLSGQAVGIPLDARPLETITDSRGVSQEVLARVRTVSDTNPYTDYQPVTNLLVVRDPKGKVGFQAVDQYDHPLLTESPKVRYGVRPRGLLDTEILFTRPTDRRSAPTLHIGPIPGSQRTLRVTTAPGAAKESASLAELGNANRSHRRGKAAKWLAGSVLAGALAHGTNTTGGFYDMVEDARTEAGTSVEQSFPTDNPEQQAAVDRVARTMQDLDDHNDAAINARAEQFKQAYHDQLLPEAETKRFQSRLEAAESHDDIIHIVNEFMQIYGKTARLRTEDDAIVARFKPHSISPDAFRQHALGVIDAYSFLPNDYVRRAGFDVLEFGLPRFDEDGNIKSGGEYGQKARTIRLAVSDYGGDTRSKAAQTALHENGHAEDPEPDHDDGGRELTTGGEVNFLLRNLIDNPADVSAYAAANGRGEKYAENTAYLLVGGPGNKLAHPDDARLFASGANRQMLDRLIKLDRRFPGISDYVVQHAGTEGRYGPWFGFWK